MLDGACRALRQPTADDAPAAWGNAVAAAVVVAEAVVAVAPALSADDIRSAAPAVWTPAGAAAGGGGGGVVEKARLRATLRDAALRGGVGHFEPPPGAPAPQGAAGGEGVPSLWRVWKKASHDAGPLNEITHPRNAARLKARQARLHTSTKERHHPAAATLSHPAYSLLCPSGGGGGVAAAAADAGAAQRTTTRAVHTPAVRSADATGGASLSLSSRSALPKVIEHTQQGRPLSLLPGMASIVTSYKGQVGIPPGVFYGTPASSSSSSSSSAPATVLLHHTTLYASQLFPQPSKKSDFLLVLRRVRKPAAAAAASSSPSPPRTFGGAFCGGDEGGAAVLTATLRRLPGSVHVSGHTQPRVAVPHPLSPELLEGLKKRVALHLAQRLSKDAVNGILKPFVRREVVDALLAACPPAAAAADLDTEYPPPARDHATVKRAAIRAVLSEGFTPNFSEAGGLLSGWHHEGYAASPLFEAFALRVVGSGGGARGSGGDAVATPELVCVTEAAAGAALGGGRVGGGGGVGGDDGGAGTEVQRLRRRRQQAAALEVLGEERVERGAAAGVLAGLLAQDAGGGFVYGSSRGGAFGAVRTKVHRVAAAVASLGGAGDSLAASATLEKLRRGAACGPGAATQAFLACAAGGGGGGGGGGDIYCPPLLTLARLTLSPKEFLRHMFGGGAATLHGAGAAGYYDDLVAARTTGGSGGEAASGGGADAGSDPRLLLALFYPAEALDAIPAKQRVQRAAALRKALCVRGSGGGEGSPANTAPGPGLLKKMFEREAVLLSGRRGTLASAAVNVSAAAAAADERAEGGGGGGKKRFRIKKVLESGVQLADEVITEERHNLWLAYNYFFGEKAEKPAAAGGPIPAPSHPRLVLPRARTNEATW